MILTDLSIADSLRSPGLSHAMGLIDQAYCRQYKPQHNSLHMRNLHDCSADGHVCDGRSSQLKYTPAYSQQWSTDCGIPIFTEISINPTFQWTPHNIDYFFWNRDYSLQ